MSDPEDGLEEVSLSENELANSQINKSANASAATIMTTTTTTTTNGHGSDSSVTANGHAVIPKSPPPEPTKSGSSTGRHSMSHSVSTAVGGGTTGPAAPGPSASPLYKAASLAGSKTSIALPNSQGLLSSVLITSALETIASSKEAKRSQPLREATIHALEMVRAGRGGDKPREVFEPLRLACETGNTTLMVASLDCISKLVSYSFFTEESPPHSAQYSSPAGSPTNSNANLPKEMALADLVTHTITSCHTESTPDAVSLQIVKALLQIVLSQHILVHHSSLLKAVRTVYNVFLLSSDPINQQVAQGGLTQMVHHVFARCNDGSAGVSSQGLGAHSPRSRSSLSEGMKNASLSAPSLTTPTMESAPQTPISHAHELRDDGSTDDEVTRAASVPLPTDEDDENDGTPNANIGYSQTIEIPVTLSTYDLFIKDAFLVFRALCKLTMKPVPPESERDLKSHPMRSKLLSLHLVLTILNSYMDLFVSPYAIIRSTSTNESTLFVQAIKQYLCLSLSRNAVSSVMQVFEASVEIFWKVLSGMRGKLKREIEVLFNEIFIPILEMRTSTIQQKLVLLNMLQRLCQDPQALVEIYINYDCDRDAIENIYEKLINIISKQSTMVHPPPKSTAQQNAQQSPTVAQSPRSAKTNTLPPSLTTSALSETSAVGDVAILEQKLHRQSLESLVQVLRSLVAWKDATSRNTNQRPDSTTLSASGNSSRSRMSISVTEDGRNEYMSSTDGVNVDRTSSVSGPDTRVATPTTETDSFAEDDPTRFESEKIRKTTLNEGIKKFNFKPKRGIQFFLETSFIPSKSPADIAAFLMETDGLNKSAIGEYLGEGEPENIAIMHAFVDRMDVTGLPFTTALRTFLQAFRLPGEAQKIDRFMLKFADRYFANNNDTPFANATGAYVLAYSTIMLNTDAHNPQVKRRMTLKDFLKNNRGINDDADLPEDFLAAIYDDIQGNEIRMKDEVEAQLGVIQPGAGLANALVNVGRDFQKEAYSLQSSGMANRTEALFKTMMRAQRRGRTNEQFFSASHFVHVRPMFEVAWMSFLAGMSGPLQRTDSLEVVELCLDGFKHAIRVACFFDMELERNAFVTTLAKFTFLNNLGEMKAKNMEAIKALLDVALSEGDHLKGSWRDVLMCVSQLEHMQLISGMEPQDGKKGKSKKLPAEELANESRSTHITVSADMIFSLSHQLSGTAIVEFVQALSDVSWEEIQSSGLSETPRLFSIRKLVEICYYNMNRIRLEWVNVWAILGEHFNQVCCHSNPHVSNFALDSLRQLAMRFLEKEELPAFKFQKDFLKPFQYTMVHNSNPESRDMVLQCLQQMIQARAHNMRSGWRTMFAVFSAASKALNESIATYAFDVVTMVNRDHFGAVIRHGSFADLTVCVADFCKLSKFQRISLVATSMLRDLVPQMLKCPECGFDTPLARQENVLKADDPMIRFWFPMLFSFVDIIMNGEDLEVRRLALESFFGNLKTHGVEFPPEFWDIVSKELIFPIFSVLKSAPQDVSRFASQEDMSVWISTTMIQALRDTIDLWTTHFTILERFLDGLLDLLRSFICQENDTLARIGTSCLQQLLQNNASKLTPQLWQRVIATFVWLFKTTTPYQLLDERLRAETESSESPGSAESDQHKAALLPAPLSPPVTDADDSNLANPAVRKRIFALIITKCVLQLLLIETTNELLQSNDVYENIPPEHLLRLMSVLDDSYQFARGFNANKEVRNGLWRVGFMRHPPNLLKQESSSAATLVNVLLRIASDKRPEHTKNREEASNRLILLGLMIIGDFNQLKPDVQGRNITAWSPVVAEVLEGFSIFDEQIFHMYLPAFYPLAVELLVKEISPEIRTALRSVLLRISPA